MSEDLAAHLQALEEQLLQPAIRADSDALTTLLADDFREFGSSGRIFTRAEIVAELATESPRSISLSDFHCQPLTPEAALVTYRTTSATNTDLRSSLWVLRDGRWQMLFHQGTKTTLY
jgi:hypothetical protein